MIYKNSPDLLQLKNCRGFFICRFEQTADVRLKKRPKQQKYQLLQNIKITMQANLKLYFFEG